MSLTRRADFQVPPELFATEPPEARGRARDEIRLLVAQTSGLRQARFQDLPRFLHPGDLVVVNTSATVPAAVDGTRSGARQVVVHFSNPLEDGSWVIELRTHDATEPLLTAVADEIVELEAGGSVSLLAPHSDGARGKIRLWRGRVRVEGSVERYLAQNGRPITYGHLRASWPLASYQTVFAREPGSAEMPSAGRPFSNRLVTRLVADGVVVAPIVLHTGLSSLEAGETPQAERFAVPRVTARLVNETRRAGGLVVAVGTTVMRALETVARANGTVVPGRGWTDLVLGLERRPWVVDGLVTGWHTPDSSHLLLLESLVGAQRVQDVYDEAIQSRYLWHEFGDSCLLLSGRSRSRERRRRVPRHLGTPSSGTAAVLS